LEESPDKLNRVAMIEARGLVKDYGPYRAVDDVNLTVYDGEIYGFLGPNGAGKTTTIRMLMGLIEPTAGTVSIGGHDIVKEPRAAKAIVGFVPDMPFLYEKLTAYEFLRFHAGIHGIRPKEVEDRINELLAFFDLAEWGGELIEGFSHGMKQRLTFAASLLHKPKVIIVDEPMVGLDPRGAKLIKETFRRLADNGCAIIMSTHTLEIAQETCDRIGIIQKGRIIAEGAMEQLKKMAHYDGGNLEDIFLSLTGGADVEQVIKILGM
jgi:ABC-2 type transport system ATP-binding protein